MNWMNPTAAELKELLGTPVALLLIMYLASLANGVKQIIVARQSGGEVTLGAYIKYWPETIGTVIGNTIAFIVLVLTDQLNFASALGIGYGVNSAVDLFRSGGRSDVMGTTTLTTQEKKDEVTNQGGFVRASMLGLLLAIGAVGVVAVPGCAAIGLQSPQTFNERYAYAISQTTGLRQTAADALTAKQISVDDAEYVLKVTDESRALLNAARAALTAGDTSTAEGRLSLATNILAQLQAYLRTKGAHA